MSRTDWDAFEAIIAKTELALFALTYLHQTQPNGATTPAIAGHCGLARKDVYPMLRALHRAGFVVSRGGNVGRFILLPEAMDFTLADIIRVFRPREGPPVPSIHHVSDLQRTVARDAG